MVKSMVTSMVRSFGANLRPSRLCALTLQLEKKAIGFVWNLCTICAFLAQDSGNESRDWL
jgi:hypothetical protein